jgi:hypothetical protein
MLNAEVQHDEFGLPYLSGKTLKGLLTASCGEIMAALDANKPGGTWQESAQRLFGGPGSVQQDARSWLHIGDATLPHDLQLAVREDILLNENISRETILATLTTMRRQTAMSSETGAPLKESLRASRVIIRGVTFTANLLFLKSPEPKDVQLLAACIKGLKRVGTNRNRGLGQVLCQLYDVDSHKSGSQAITDKEFGKFEMEVLQ